MSEDGVERLRRRIDEIDVEIVRLLNERARCAVEIGEAKRASGRTVYDPEREREILERVLHMSASSLDPGALRRIFERILDESRRLERESASRR